MREGARLEKRFLTLLGIDALNVGFIVLGSGTRGTNGDQQALTRSRRVVNATAVASWTMAAAAATFLRDPRGLSATSRGTSPAVRLVVAGLAINTIGSLVAIGDARRAGPPKSQEVFKSCYLLAGGVAISAAYLMVLRRRRS